MQLLWNGLTVARA